MYEILDAIERYRMSKTAASAILVDPDGTPVAADSYLKRLGASVKGAIKDRSNKIWQGVKATPGNIWAGIKATPGLAWGDIKGAGKHVLRNKRKYGLGALALAGAEEYMRRNKKGPFAE